jgi:hypothetical protein
MIEILPSLPRNVVGFTAKGTISQEDYENVVFPEVKKFSETHKALNYVFVVDTSPKEFTVGAWIKDVWLGLKEFSHWHRVAIVSDEEKIRSVPSSVTNIMPGQYRGFPVARLEDAIKWAAAN